MLHNNKRRKVNLQNIFILKKYDTVSHILRFFVNSESEIILL